MIETSSLEDSYLNSSLAKCRKSWTQSFLGEKTSLSNGTCSLHCLARFPRESYENPPSQKKSKKQKKTKRTSVLHSTAQQKPNTSARVQDGELTSQTGRGGRVEGRIDSVTMTYSRVYSLNSYLLKFIRGGKRKQNRN